MDKKKKKRNQSAWREAFGDMRRINWGYAVLVVLGLAAVVGLGFRALFLLLPLLGIVCMVAIAKGTVSGVFGCAVTVAGIILLIISLAFTTCMMSSCGSLGLH